MPTCRRLRVALTLSAFLFAGAVTPAFAQSSSTQSQASSARTAGSASHGDPSQAIEDRINDLHAKLKITQNEEPQWGDVARVMRDNGRSIHGLMQMREQNASGMNAVDDLKSYRDIAEAHAKGLDQLIPAFQKLYDAMPADQKKLADKVFGEARTQRIATGVRNDPGQRSTQ